MILLSIVTKFIALSQNRKNRLEISMAVLSGKSVYRVVKSISFRLSPKSTKQIPSGTLITFIEHVGEDYKFKLPKSVAQTLNIPEEVVLKTDPSNSLMLVQLGKYPTKKPNALIQFIRLCIIIS